MRTYICLIADLTLVAGYFKFCCYVVTVFCVYETRPLEIIFVENDIILGKVTCCYSSNRQPSRVQFLNLCADIDLCPANESGADLGCQDEVPAKHYCLACKILLILTSLS